MPFQRMKVRLKKEIVTLKVPGLDPARDAAPYVDPGDWNARVDDPDTVLIDIRNGFEVGYSRLAGAVDPQTKRFGDFRLEERRAGIACASMCSLRWAGVRQKKKKREK